MQNTEYLLKEYNLSTNDFKQPKEDTGKKAVGMFIARLILLEPGTFSSRPKMGLGLVSRFRDMFPDRLPQLKRDLYHQLETYLPQYQNAEIILTQKDGRLLFDITIDDYVYKYITVEQEDNKVTLQELTEAT